VDFGTARVEVPRFKLCISANSCQNSSDDFSDTKGDTERIPCYFRKKMRKVYLKIATRSLVLGVLVHEAVRSHFQEPVAEALQASIASAHYRLGAIVGLELLFLLALYKLVSLIILIAFESSRSVRVLVDSLFGVEGCYLEVVSINNELEVVGLNHIKFKDGALTVNATLYWPREEQGNLVLREYAHTTSVEDLCTATKSVLQYGFSDVYLDNASLNKTGVTKLNLHEGQSPSLVARIFRRTIETYSGTFAALENTIHGEIRGTRLVGRQLRLGTSSKPGEREELLIAEVNERLEPISVGRDRKVQQPREQVEKLRTRRFGCLVVAHEGHRARRQLEADRYPVGQDGTAAAHASEAPARVSPSACSRPRCHGGDPLRAADRLPVERLGRDRDLLLLIGVPQVSRVARRRRVPRVLASGTPCLRRCEGHRLELALHGRGDDQSPSRGGKRPGRIPRTAARTGPNAVSSPMARAFPSASRLTAQIATTTSSWPRPSPASRWTGLGPRARSPKGSVSTRATITPKPAPSESHLVSRFIYEAEARRRRSWSASRA
jgi:hypothetical protein